MIDYNTMIVIIQSRQIESKAYNIPEEYINTLIIYNDIIVDLIKDDLDFGGLYDWKVHYIRNSSSASRYSWHYYYDRL